MGLGTRRSCAMRAGRWIITSLFMGTNASTGKGKSHVFASAKTGRRRLKKEMAETSNAVLFHWRDLGAHANVARNTWGPTLCRRMTEAARMAGPIRALPGDQDAKARILKAKMLPAALYGAETSFVVDSNLKRLRGAVFSVLRPKYHMGGNAAHLFAEAAIRGHEVDPELLIAYRMGCGHGQGMEERP